MKDQSKEKMQKSRGRFIAFEGIDGSGKSSQIQRLAERLSGEGIDYYTTMEPTDSPIGSLIRQVLTGQMNMDNRVIAALFAADRLDHLLNEVNGIAAKISKGTTVVSDRYYFSSYAYHSVDVPMDWVIKANEQSRLILKPTLSLFLDVSPEVAMERIVKNRTHLELFEKQSRLVKVREKYLEAFERLKDTEQVVMIDGNKSPQETAEAVWQAVGGLFS